LVCAIAESGFWRPSEQVMVRYMEFVGKEQKWSFAPNEHRQN
jgi:hypothetical protein